MPQQPANSFVLDDSTTIQYDPAFVPPGFDTLPLAAKKAFILQSIQQELANRKTEEEVTATDIILPIVLVSFFALLILFIARKIRDNPKVYDTVVKMDGEPNAEFGKGWKKSKK
ncbi:MAG: hypothetical protein ABIO05_08480 [Ferruginibacter sp.]